MKKLLKQYYHIWPILVYLPIYLLWFFTLEGRDSITYTIIESSLDAAIPFNEWFIIPYLIWFPFIAVSVSFFFFKSRTEYYRLCILLISGMTISLFIYTIFPNAVALRPELSSLSRSNPALSLVQMLHKADTPTNVCPSLHVYNSLAICIAVFASKQFKKKRLACIAVTVLTFFICLSTVFLKQHSVVDIFYAFVLAAVLMPLIYIIPRHRATAKS